MKKFLVTIVMMSLSIATFAQVENDSVKTESTENSGQISQKCEVVLPETVKDAIAKNYPDAVIKEVNRDEKDGTVVFEVKIADKDNNLQTVKFDEKGEKVE